MVTDPDYAAALTGMATAYRTSTLLFAAIELDLFSAIPAEGATLEFLAQRLEAQELPLRLLLNTLVGMGLLVKEGARFHLPSSYGFLLQSGPEYLGNHLLLHKEQNEHWLRMADEIRGRAAGPTPYESLVTSSRIQYYLDAVERFNRPYADQLISYLGSMLPRVRRVLDIGGGHGYYAQRLLELSDTATVMILDLDRSIEHGKARQSGNPHYGRLEFAKGNALTQDYDNAFDLVMINDLLHYFPMNEKLEVTRRATNALRPGGTIAISKFRLDDGGVDPPLATLLSLRVYLNTRKGYLETDREAVDLLTRTGARDIQIVPLGELKTLIMGVR